MTDQHGALPNERESVIVRFRHQPPGQQILIAAGILLLLLLAYLLFRPTGAPKPPPPGPTPVGVVVVREEPVTLTSELPGRTSPYETSDVRPQVNGIIRARLFKEGDFVGAGQPLYQIEPSTYRANVTNARGALANAQATIASTEALARRYGELVKINGISRQEYDNAVAAARQARANVTTQQGALEAAQIDLQRTTIRAPISGRTGISTYTTGALVTAQQTQPLTTIQRLDPIYVDIQQSSADLLRLREQMLSGQISREAAPVQLVLETGSVYPNVGSLRFADVTVDPTTGSQTIRAIFPNPQRLLLPGMFVRARLTQGTKTSGILVPQAAVTRDPRGRATVMVVGPGNKAMVRPIETTQSVGDNWLVISGLKPGDKVIVEAGPLLQPGAPVTPQPWHPTAGKQ
jgi:membrane fusion protein (multidrug efflux system)